MAKAHSGRWRGMAAKGQQSAEASAPQWHSFCMQNRVNCPASLLQWQLFLSELNPFSRLNCTFIALSFNLREQ